MLVQADSTYAQIEITVRRLTASPSEASLPTALIQQYVNTFYNSDFPYGIKVDQMRDVYTFYTVPYQDKYPLDVNYNQGIRAPVYVDGIQGTLVKDRMQFFGVWPNFPTTFQPASGDGITTSFSFTLGSTPIVRGTVIIGYYSTSGEFINISDDSNGVLQYNFPSPQVSVPAPNTVSPVTTAPPGMYNRNTANPGVLTKVNVGTINYVTGAVTLTLTPVIINLVSITLTPAASEILRTRCTQFQPGRPYSVLFWNNEFTIRPIPKQVHAITVETYLSPVQFLNTTDSPILNQWSQYIALGAAKKILRDRQDMEGVANLEVFFKEQEALVLERQGVEEIGSRNTTLFSGSSPNSGALQGWWGGGGWF